MSQLLVLAGTRPELIKLGPVVRELRGLGLDVDYRHTGQHPVDGLGGPGAWRAHPSWPEPMPVAGEWQHMGNDPICCTADGFDIVHAHGNALRVQPDGEKPRALLVQGDTSTTIVGATVAAMWGLPLIHLEAGLRCWDDRVPEERIRREVDRRADLLLAPSELCAQFARVDAKATARIEVVGQTGIDAMREVAALDERYVHVSKRPWVLLTLHRAEWTDGVAAAAMAGRIAGVLAGSRDVVTIWPAHPRWALSSFESLRVTPPWSYAAMVSTLHRNPPQAVVTDSGGLVEEATALGIPTLLVRDTTERWECLGPTCWLVPPRHGSKVVADHLVALLGMRGSATDTISRAWRCREPYAPPSFTNVFGGNATASMLAARAVQTFLQEHS